MKKYLFIILIIIPLCLFSYTIEETLVQIDSLKKELAHNKQIVEENISNLKKNNPLFADQDPFESNEEYINRLNKTIPLIKQIREQYLAEIEEKLNVLRNNVFETENVNVFLDSDKYDPNKEEWQIAIDQLDYKKEHYELTIKIDKNTAKNLFKNKDQLIFTGIQVVDIGDNIGLAKITIIDTVNDFVGEYEIQPMLSIYHNGYSNWVNSVAFSPDGKFLATGCDNKKAKIFNLETGNEVANFEHRGNVKSVGFSPDGKLLATGTGVLVEKAHIFNIETGNQFRAYGYNGSSVTSVVFSSDGKFMAIATGSYDEKAHIYELDSGSEIRSFEQNNWVTSVAFSPDDSFLAVGTEGNGFRIYDIATGNEVKSIGHFLRVTSLAFSPDGFLLAIGCKDHTARVYNFKTGNEIINFKHDHTVESVTFSSDGKFLATGSIDNKARIFNIETRNEVKTFYHSEFVNSVAFSPDDKYLAVGCNDGYAYIYRTLFRIEDEGIFDKPLSTTPKLSAGNDSGDTDRISKSTILNNIETAFVEISYSPLNDGTPRYLGTSLDEGMSIEITGNENNVSSATFAYGVTDTYNENTIDHRMLIANRFLQNTVPEMNDTGGWLEEKMTDAAGRIQSGYSEFKDSDYLGNKTVTFKFYKSLGICYVTVSFN